MENSMNRIQLNRTQIVQLLTEGIKRLNAIELNSFIDYLDTIGYFEAPASIKHHSAYPGGLAEHSLIVYDYLFDEMVNTFGANWEDYYSKESVIIVGLFHDLCKCNLYKLEETDEGTRYVYNNRSLKMGRGALSMYMLTNYMMLTDHEAQAIYWHLGAFDLSPNSNQYDLGNAFTHNALAFLLHIADMKATYIMENTENPAFNI